MYFLPIICFLLGLFFYLQGRRHDEARIKAFGGTLMLAAVGIAIILFFALKVLAST